MQTPRGMLFDYGGTLVEEVAFDTRAGIEFLLTQTDAPVLPTRRAEIFERGERVTREVGDRRDLYQIETPWPLLTRLIHDYCGTRFVKPLSELELGFWNASVTTRIVPGVRDALHQFQQAGISMGVVSNSSFASHVIRHELAKHDLADFFPVIVVSAEYAVRKPNPLLFEVAAALLGVPCTDIWFVGDRLDTDMKGARAARMTPVWFAPQKDMLQTDELIVAPSWAALAAMFGAA